MVAAHNVNGCLLPMHFAFTDEQDMLRESVRGALERGMSPTQARTMLESGDGAPARELARAQGWTGIGVPEELGGQGGGLVELAILFEELGRASGPDVLLVQLGLADGLLAAAGPHAAELRAALTAGDLTAAVLVPSVGAPGTMVAPLEVQDAGGGLLVSGEVDLVLGADGADVLLAVVQGPEELEVVAIDVLSGGASITPFAVADLARPLARVVLRAAAGRRLGPWDPAGAPAIADRLAVLVAADALGASRRLLEMTVEYVLQREQFGSVIGGFQAVKHMAADMLVDVEVAFSAVYHAAATVEAGHADASQYAAIAHWVASGAGGRAGDRALALHGAVGFTWEHDLHFPMKRARADASLFASADHQLARIADDLGIPRRIRHDAAVATA